MTFQPSHKKFSSESLNDNHQEGICPTGIEGLDKILQGGLPCGSLYVIQGEPGSGKTTVALQFLLEGIRRGKKSLYITFSETKKELEHVAASHGWDLSNIVVVDLSVLEQQISPQSQTTFFHPSEIELNEVTEILLKKIDEVSPARIVFDSISEMRLLAETPLRYRRQVLALKQALAKRDSTVLVLDDLTTASQDLQVQSIAHGVISLSRLHHEYGGERRRLRILKLRGVRFIAGNHDFDIETGGVVVFPRMISSMHSQEESPGQLQSSSKELDDLLGGGLDRGTANLFIGPPGTGKSTLVLKYALAATSKNEKVAYFCFDETIANFRKRAYAMDFKIDAPIKSGMLRIEKVDPAELSPGAFSHLIQSYVENENVKVIAIDSLNGYIQAMPQEQYLPLQLHELLAYLNNRGVITMMTIAQQGMIGNMTSPVDLTYLADSVILSRFFESKGTIRKAISVTKKRTGHHEATIREYTVGKGGVLVGPPLKEFEGVLTGIPKFHGDQNLLSATRGKDAQ